MARSTVVLREGEQEFRVPDLHPRAQVQSLRRAAQHALLSRVNDPTRARAAIALMRRLNAEHNLGYPMEVV